MFSVSFKPLVLGIWLLQIFSLLCLGIAELLVCSGGYIPVASKPLIALLMLQFSDKLHKTGVRFGPGQDLVSCSDHICCNTPSLAN